MIVESSLGPRSRVGQGYRSRDVTDDFASLHVHQAAAPNPAANAGESVNAYIVELMDGVICIDAMLTTSDSRALRGKIEELGKPLLAVLLTHGHTDHYGGTGYVTGGDDVPVVATGATDRVIRDNHAAKDEFMPPLYGAEWPRNVVFPTRTLEGGDIVSFGGADFQVNHLGPGESGADGYWTCSALPGIIFRGDIVYNGYHALLGDGHSAKWLDTLDKVVEPFASARLLCPGHGGLVIDPLAAIARQRAYIEAVRAAVEDIARGRPELDPDGKAEVKARLLTLPGYGRRLEFFLDVSMDPVAAELAGLHRPA